MPFKVIAYKGRRLVRNVNFSSLEAAIDAAEIENRRGLQVDLCDTETSRLMSHEALRPHTLRRRVIHG